MACVILENLVKKYGNTQVIHSITAQIKDGEFIVIVGPSGCGKSTLLRMIAGLEQVNSGKIHINNTCVNNVEPKDRDIAMVFQNYALYPHMTVFNNMAYGLKLKKFTRKEIRTRVNETAELLQLKDLLTRKPKELSGGQRQRVAMGRAIVRNPSVFLFDEPLSNLDAKLRQTMRIELKKLHTRLKTTMIYVTHDQVEAMTLADRIIVMKDGIIEQMGTPKELYEKPETVFAAQFIGSPEINLLKAKTQGPRVIFQTIGNNDNDSILCGIRPEHMEIVTGSQKPDIVFDAKIDIIERLGADTLYYFKTNGNNTQFIIKLNQDLNLTPGKKIRIGFSWIACHFFDRETEKKINLDL